MSNRKSLNYLKDIRFWIFLFFIARLYGIWFPPIDISHNWRQTTVTMVARNFLEIDPNPFYPRLDISGELTGITGMEFPLLNYLCYLLSLVFGYQHWYGRLIVLVISSFGLFYFYKLVKSYFEEKVAFNASIVLLFSIWFTYSRKIMPDTFSLSLILFALWLLAAVALACSTRFDTIPTLAICSGIFLAGLMSDYFFGLPAAKGSWWASTLYSIVPNWQLFWLADALETGKSTFHWAYVGKALGYVIFYAGAALAVAVALFDDRELS